MIKKSAIFIAAIMLMSKGICSQTDDRHYTEEMRFKNAEFIASAGKRKYTVKFIQPKNADHADLAKVELFKNGLKISEKYPLEDTAFWCSPTGIYRFSGDSMDDFIVSFGLIGASAGGLLSVMRIRDGSLKPIPAPWGEGISDLSLRDVNNDGVLEIITKSRFSLPLIYEYRNGRFWLAVGGAFNDIYQPYEEYYSREKAGYGFIDRMTLYLLEGKPDMVIDICEKAIRSADVRIAKNKDYNSSIDDIQVLHHAHVINGDAYMQKGELQKAKSEYRNSGMADVNGKVDAENHANFCISNYYYGRGYFEKANVYMKLAEKSKDENLLRRMERQRKKVEDAVSCIEER